MKTIKHIQKRDGIVEPFDKKKIVDAIEKAFNKSNEGNRFIANQTTESVVETLLRAYSNQIPTVEQVQDIVEDTLISYNFKHAAKEYIRYRYERNKQRVMV